MAHKLEIVSSYNVELGEGPHWDERNSRLYHVDLIRGDCYSLDPVTKQHDKIHLPEAATLIVPIEDSEDFLVSQNRSICQLNWATKSLKPLGDVDDGKDTRINDGKIDPAGRLYYGTMNWERKPGVFEPGLGSLYSMDSDGSIKLREPGITISNGLAWTEDAKKFFFIDSLAYQVWIYDYDMATGAITNRKTVFDFKKHQDKLGAREIPDGMTIDLSGKIYVAVFHGNKVMKIDPETGTWLDTIVTPAMRTTSATFGGPDFSTLYITSATFGASPEEIKAEPDAGKVFKVTFEKENVKGSRNLPFACKNQFNNSNEIRK
ncbi:regucalcin-like [Brevipalpus obovatus]|uniref:regucalcin-like n=1 Tax=Brevipalpus obovatus TaxID=246614 RepID=UPI003D9F1164